MKSTKAVVTEQTVTFAVSVDDLKALLPRKYRKAVEEGATFEAKFNAPSGGDYSGMGVDIGDRDIVLSVFQRSAPKVAE